MSWLSTHLTALTFATKWLMWIALFSPLAVIAVHLYDRARRRQLTRRLRELPIVSRVMATMSPGRRAFKDGIAAGALMLVLLAAARPQLAGKRKVELRGDRKSVV